MSVRGLVPARRSHAIFGWLLFLVVMATAFQPGVASAAMHRSNAAASTACLTRFRVVRGQGTACPTLGGLWKIRFRGDRYLFSHGPDVETRTAAAAAATAATSAPPRSPVCTNANPSGPYGFVAIIAWPSDGSQVETNASLRSRIAAYNGAFYNAAVESGSPNGADFSFACDSTGEIRVDDVRLPTPAGSATYSTISSDLAAKGYNRTNEKYVVWYDGHISPNYCGQANLYRDESASAGNRADTGPSYGIAYQCDVLLHELSHTLGAVGYNAPHGSGTTGHCWDEYDIMCSPDGDRYPGYYVYNCTDRWYYDCGHDDYFDAEIGVGQGGGVGSYLDTHWNIGGCYDRFVVNRACSVTQQPAPPPPAPPPPPPPATTSAYASTILAAHPVAYWRLGERSGAVAADASGNGHSATYVNGVALGGAGAIRGDPDSSASFDGVNDYVQAPNLSLGGGLLGLNSAFSLELWVYGRNYGSTGATGWDTLLGYDYSHRILWDPGYGHLLTQFDGNFVSTTAVWAQSWQYVVYTFDGSTERFYINGQAAGSHATPKPVWNQPFRLASYDNANLMLNGSLDEVAVYNRALSASEVQQHYAAH
jgi:Concanavalin A-like lectin/glucanases superfamily